MSNPTSTTTRLNVVAGMLNWLGRCLLIVPEAALLVVLLAVYPALGMPLTLALIVVLLITVFTIRTLALQIAQLAIAAGRLDDAKALLWLAQVLYPYSADTLALQGTLLMAEGALEQAEQALRSAVRLLPTQPSFHVALSSALIELGRPVEAARSAKQALMLAPEFAQAYLCLAEAERASGTTNAGTEKLLRIGLGFTKRAEEQVALQCALAAYLLSERRIAEAALVLRGVEAILPGCPAPRRAALHSMLGELRVSQGQTERVREHSQNVEAAATKGGNLTPDWRTT
ncbi:MAG: hypothetical protein H7Z42_08140 [Roseiflexaceae bacterium]|nr:hypothetical protein [Roseiflexaceae bacterium]